jgi:hypothetical protein
MVELQVYRLRIIIDVAPKPIASPVICKRNHCFNFKLSAKLAIDFIFQNIIALIFYHLDFDN